MKWIAITLLLVGCANVNERQQKDRTLQEWMMRCANAGGEIERRERAYGWEWNCRTGDLRYQWR